MKNTYQHFLSFGFNCEVSFALQLLGVFESSTFSWADIRGTDALVRAIKETDRILIDVGKQYGGNMFFCEATGVGFHGRLKFQDAVLADGSVDQAVIDASLSELKQRIIHLECKQKAAFDDGNVLVVFKHFSDVFDEPYTPEESVYLIEQALSAKYNTRDFNILCVTDSDCSINYKDSDRFKFRSISSFSPRSKAADIDKEAWRSVMSEFIGAALSDDSEREILKKASEYWSQPRGAPLTRWWTNPRIIRHVNKLICGEPIDGHSSGIYKRLLNISGGKAFKKGISIGAGSGAKEIKLLNRGLVDKFDVYELSLERIREGEALAIASGVADRIRFFALNCFQANVADDFDLVYWDSALHHMLDVDVAIKWSKDHLCSGGLFFMHDFVGPSRFQWTDYQLNIASQVRHILPERLLRNPVNGQILPRTIKRPSIEAMLALDPTEAADSSNIVESLRRHFPNVDITFIGGCVYHSPLNDVMANLDGEADQLLLDSLLLLDECLAHFGNSHFAVASAFKL